MIKFKIAQGDCSVCAHAAICSLKETKEAYLNKLMIVEDNENLTVDITASCNHYLESFHLLNKRL